VCDDCVTYSPLACYNCVTHLLNVVLHFAHKVHLIHRPEKEARSSEYTTNIITIIPINIMIPKIKNS
jgi:hypothetical protein